MDRKTASKAQREHLDKLNNGRLEKSKKRIAEAIRMLRQYAWHDNLAAASLDQQKMTSEIAKAVTIIEAAEQDMEWHCEWFGYDNSVCLLMNDACLDFGNAISESFNDNPDAEMLMSCDVKDGCIKLSKALATLICWNDVVDNT